MRIYKDMNNIKNEEKLKKKHNKKNSIGYVLGSIGLLVATSVTIPVIITKVSGIMFKKTMRTSQQDDNWGPIIERKEAKDKEETYSGN